MLEAEGISVLEALTWMKNQQLYNQRVELESDSMLVVHGIIHNKQNLLEVGEVLKACKSLLDELTETSIHFVRNQANLLKWRWCWILLLNILNSFHKKRKEKRMCL